MLVAFRQEWNEATQEWMSPVEVGRAVTAQECCEMMLADADANKIEMPEDTNVSLCGRFLYDYEDAVDFDNGSLPKPF